MSTSSPRRDPDAPRLRITIRRGDITVQDTDAIVNAANSALAGGAGVNGAIHAAAGPELPAACRELRRTVLPGGLAVGQAVATTAGRLPARWVIHTVGPNRHAGETDPALLASCFRGSLEVADRLGALSVAFPAISAGIYGWQPDTVARVGLTEVLAYDGGVQVVEFVLFSAGLAEVFRSVHAELAA
jgi:O-acetyl-ADP-ribose deacetylase